MVNEKLIARKRSEKGSACARRLRRSGTLPGVLYGVDAEPVPVGLEAHALEQMLHHHASEALLVEIDMEGEGTLSVLIKDVQRHPVTNGLMHVDLQRVSVNQPIHAEIPVELKGEAEGVKIGGTLEHVMHAVSVVCLPTDLVEVIEVDVSALQIGDVLHASDIKVSDKVKLLVNADVIVAAISGPKTEQSADSATESDENP